MSLRAQVLCRVVDNFGDAGICWRLSRQLVREHRWQVRLTIDRPELLARLGAREDDGVQIETWLEHDDGGEAPDVLLSAFGAEPGPALRASLAGAPAVPVWVQLEYLSAEAWVAGYHGLRSTKPADGAVEHYFYPGFDDASGGLLRERHLIAQRDAFVGSQAQRRFLDSLGIETNANESLATLFCYPQAPVAEWLATIADGPRRWRVVVPESVADDALVAFFGESPAPGRTMRWGRLAVQRIEFLTQDAYDRLLWSADLNFVRGEDSWIRAQWAARPFVWQPYRQQQDTHRVKLSAFLERMRAGDLVDTMMHGWSAEGTIAPAWSAFEAALPGLAPRYREWSTKLCGQTDLATRLVTFCTERLR